MCRAIACVASLALVIVPALDASAAGGSWAVTSHADKSKIHKLKIEALNAELSAAVAESRVHTEEIRALAIAVIAFVAVKNMISLPSVSGLSVAQQAVLEVGLQAKGAQSAFKDVTTVMDALGDLSRNP